MYGPPHGRPILVDIDFIGYRGRPTLVGITFRGTTGVFARCVLRVVFCDVVFLRVQCPGAR